MTRVGVISDEFWAAVESLMPSDVGRRGHRFADHRLILRGSRGGSVPVRRGGICPPISGRGRRFGNATTGFRSTAPISGSSMSCAGIGPMTSSTTGWRGCCRSTRRWCARTSTPPGARCRGHRGLSRITRIRRSRARRPCARPLPGRANHQDSCPDRYRDGPGRDDAHRWAGRRQPALLPLLDGYFVPRPPPTLSVMSGCWPIRRTRIPPPAPHCASAGESSTRSPNATIRSLGARPRARPVVDHRPLTAKSTGCATP